MKENKNFKPMSSSIKNIELPLDLLEKIDIVASNVHDEWARKRIAEGWQFGNQRNDSLKLHPGLVPYEELAEEEKDYDRQTALTTLKSVILLGFKIE